MTISFVPINVKDHRDVVIPFRKDSFHVSFGSTDDFQGEEDYLTWLEEKKKAFPKGFMMVKRNDAIIGQIELSTQVYDGKLIGYVHLYYLIKEERGNGTGDKLHEYAQQYFRNYGVNEFHLRVSPTNKPALQFYRKSGLEEIGPEFDGKVIRMKGKVPAHG